LVIIMRELAGEQVSVAALPGQSPSAMHQRPVSAHIFAGCPSAQKSPVRAELHDGSPDDMQAVFAVTTPCLQDPHDVPDEPTHASLRKRPDPSTVEIARQKSPLIALLHVESDAQRRPLVSLQ
jgi:hypothetical protein